jgi:hypothetical protein
MIFATVLGNETVDPQPATALAFAASDFEHPHAAPLHIAH